MTPGFGSQCSIQLSYGRRRGCIVWRMLGAMLPSQGVSKQLHQPNQATQPIQAREPTKPTDITPCARYQAYVMRDMKIILGIGNPGAEYALTRHNVGFMMLDRIALQHGLTWNKQAKWQAQVTTWSMAPGDDKVLLVKPQTYVNLSGRSLQAAMAFYQTKPEDILVVVDDIHIPLGALRLRAEGSAGGHNGLKHIQQHIGKTYPRLRFGIGQPAHDQIDWVLGKFSADEEPDLISGLQRAQQQTEAWLQDGMQAAQSFNGPLPKPKPIPRAHS